MNKIKKLVLIVSCFISVLFVTDNVYASSTSISVSNSSPQVGSKVTITVTVSNVNTVALTANISGAGTNSTIRLVDGSMTGAKNFKGSVQVVPTTTGTIHISISSDSNAVLNGEYVDVSGSKSITVKEKSTNTNGGSSTNGSSNSGSNSANTTTPQVDTRSKDNNLSSLSISEGTLSPKFDASTKNYSVSLTSDINDITIDAKAKDSKAKVTGVGKKSIVIGSQTFEIVVTAENGSKKTYTITVDVAEKPTVFTKLGNDSLGLLIDVSKVTAPEGYKGQTVTLEDTTIQGWINETTGLTLVYLMDENSNKNFYIYDDGKVIKKYENIEIMGKKYVLLDIPEELESQVGLIKAKIRIGDLEIDGWSFEDENHKNYSVVYLMNDNGEKNMYSYEGTEGTIQKYVPYESTSTNTLTYIFIATTAIFAVTSIGIAFSFIKFKKKSISAIKDYYDRKNQG